MRNTRVATMGIVGAALLALAGCSGGGTPSAPATGGAMASSTKSATTTTTTTGTTTTTAPATGGAMIDMKAAKLGDILTDGNGQVLYTYDPDGGSGSSTCTDACANAWPPVTATGEATAGPGVQSALLGTTKRADGTVQVTYGGWPLYLYSGDSADGTANGQGVGGMWWVMGVTGTQVRN